METRAPLVGHSAALAAAWQFPKLEKCCQDRCSQSRSLEESEMISRQSFRMQSSPCDWKRPSNEKENSKNRAATFRLSAPLAPTCALRGLLALAACKVDHLHNGHAIVRCQAWAAHYAGHGEATMGRISRRRSIAPLCRSARPGLEFGYAPAETTPYDARHVGRMQIWRRAQRYCR